VFKFDRTSLSERLSDVLFVKEDDRGFTLGIFDTFRSDFESDLYEDEFEDEREFERETERDTGRDAEPEACFAEPETGLAEPEIGRDGPDGFNFFVDATGLFGTELL
jgi:hypothetical protein